MDDHCRECAAQINRAGFDVLFANPCVFLRVTSIAKHVQIPSTIYLHEPYRWLYEALPRLPWAALPKASQEGVRSFARWRRYIADAIHVLALRLQMREEIENASAFNAILVNSLYSRESILRAYGLESKVCYLGVDHDEFVPSGEPDFLGRRFRTAPTRFELQTSLAKYGHEDFDIRDAGAINDLLRKLGSAVKVVIHTYRSTFA